MPRKNIIDRAAAELGVPAWVLKEIAQDLGTTDDWVDFDETTAPETFENEALDALFDRVTQ